MCEVIQGPGVYSRGAFRVEFEEVEGTEMMFRIRPEGAGDDAWQMRICKTINALEEFCLEGNDDDLVVGKGNRYLVLSN